MRKIWVVLLLVFAIIFIGMGAYLGREPEWTKQTYYDYYNDGQFDHVALNSRDPWLKSLALTQIGTIVGSQAFNKIFSLESRSAMAKYAIGVLKEAVRNNPDNQEAKYNLDLLMSKLFPERQAVEEEEEAVTGTGPGYSPGGGDRGY